MRIAAWGQGNMQDTRINRITAVLELVILIKGAEEKQELRLASLSKVVEVQFDGLITLERSKRNRTHQPSPNR
jgi:hypothetical protein